MFNHLKMRCQDYCMHGFLVIYCSTEQLLTFGSRFAVDDQYS